MQFGQITTGKFESELHKNIRTAPQKNTGVIHLKCAYCSCWELRAVQKIKNHVRMQGVQFHPTKIFRDVNEKSKKSRTYIKISAIFAENQCHLFLTILKEKKLACTSLNTKKWNPAYAHVKNNIKICKVYRQSSFVNYLLAIRNGHVVFFILSTIKAYFFTLQNYIRSMFGL